MYNTPRRCNVDMLKLIQIGLCLTNEKGELPSINGELCLWQFNFRYRIRVFRASGAPTTIPTTSGSFDLQTTCTRRTASTCCVNLASILRRTRLVALRCSSLASCSCHQASCSTKTYAACVCQVSLILSSCTSSHAHAQQVRWITFHSGYDFGYLLKALTCQPLPDSEDDFFQLLKVCRQAPVSPCRTFHAAQVYFANIIDIKVIMKACGTLHGGLNKLAETLDVERIGPQHQAGSDSLLTSAVFRKLVETHFNSVEDLDPHIGVLYGLGVDGANEINASKD